MRDAPPSSPPLLSRRYRRRGALRVAVALSWLALVAGCGQKGPLYHPPGSEDEKDEDKTSAAPPAPGSHRA